MLDLAGATYQIEWPPGPSATTDSTNPPTDISAPGDEPPPPAGLGSDAESSPGQAESVTDRWQKKSKAAQRRLEKGRAVKPRSTGPQTGSNGSNPPKLT